MQAARAHWPKGEGNFVRIDATDGELLNFDARARALCKDFAKGVSFLPPRFLISYRIPKKDSLSLSVISNFDGCHCSGLQQFKGLI